MRVSELLNAFASWLESPDNEALLLSEYDDKCLQIVAEACVKASEILKEAGSKTDEIEPKESYITPENIDNLAKIASEFDLSGDIELKKQASLIDELLLTISASKDFIKIKQAENDNRLEDLKKKYEDTKKELDKLNKREKSEKAIEDSDYLKNPNVNDFPLKSRYCPDHPGVSVIRLSDTSVQCSLDKKVYDYEAGFTLQDGKKVPGTSVQNQSKLDHFQQASLFNSRDERLGENKG